MANHAQQMSKWQDVATFYKRASSQHKKAQQMIDFYRQQQSHYLSAAAKIQATKQ